MDLLLLTVPAQHGASNPAVITDLRKLKAWLADLALEDVLRTVPQLSTALVQLNELELAASARLKLLEQYRRVFDTVLFTYDEMGLGVLGLDNAARRRLNEDILWLFQSLANGYKIIVKQRVEEGATPARDGALLLAVWRAMEVLSLTLLCACRVQMPPPPMTFLEIHQLYSLGESHAALDTTLRVDGGERSLGGLFRQYALFAISQQPRWEDADLLHLYTFLERFCAACTLQPENSHERHEAAYRIDLGEDQAPLPGHWSSAPGGRASCRLLDVWPVLNMLGEWLATQDVDTTTLSREMELEFVDRLATQLAEPGAGQEAVP